MARKPPPPRGPQLEIAGDLAVAFVNTAAARDNNRQQGVSSYPELLTWSQQVGVLQAHDAGRLARQATEDPAAALAAWAHAEAARRALVRLFIAIHMEKDLPAGDLEVFNRSLARALPAARVVPAAEGVDWGWAGDADDLGRMLWPVLFAAAELLISTEGRPQVRQCALKECRLWFVDRSPSRQRRWCEMKTCGNRAKSLRHYYRHARERRDKHMRGVGIWHVRRPRKQQQLPKSARRRNRNVV